MKNEQWEYITAHWGDSDPVIMEEIAKIKDSDTLEYQNLNQSITDRDNKILELTHQNVDLNKTNMNLILRLTDPKLAPAEEKHEELEVPKLTDLDAFVK